MVSFSEAVPAVVVAQLIAVAVPFTINIGKEIY